MGSNNEFYAGADETRVLGAHGWQPELIVMLGLTLLIISALAGLVAAWRSATFDPARTFRMEYRGRE